MGALVGSLGLISGCAGDPPDPRIDFAERVNKDLASAYQPSHNETAGWAQSGNSISNRWRWRGWRRLPMSARR
ncbi:hypothetical protein QNM99_11065 [Pseudomonas sp. PCH446]